MKIDSVSLSFLYEILEVNCLELNGIVGGDILKIFL